MMTIDFTIFMEILGVYDMKYTTYHGKEEKLLMEISGNMDESFNKHLVGYMYHQPIVELTEEPDLSDIDLIEEMSNVE